MKSNGKHFFSLSLQRRTNTIFIRNMTIKKCLYIVLLSICCLAGRGETYFRQADLYDMRLLNQQSGLNNNTLAGIYQDEDGFMWLGTDVGLNCYDGIHFHTYDLQKNEPAAIKEIVEDANGLLWLQIEGWHEIACFDKIKRRYLTLESDTPQLLAGIGGMVKSGNKLYVSTLKGLAELSTAADGERVNVSFNLLSETPADIVCLCSDESAVYALTAARKLFVYHTDSHKREYADCKNLNIDCDIPIDNIYTFNGYVWICPRWGAAVCYNPATGQCREVVYTYGKSGFNSTYIRDISQVDSCTFIVAARNTLYKMTFDGEDLLDSAYHIEDLSSQLERYVPALDNGITQIYYDSRNSVLWVGTFGRGILKLNIGQRMLHRVRLGDEKIKVIKAIAQDAGGYVWLATEQSGIYRSVGNEISTDMQFTRWEKAEVSNNYCMYKGKNGNLWIGDLKGTVLCMNPLSGEITSYHPSFENNKPIGEISTLYLNTRGYLWIATDKGLLIYDAKNNKNVAEAVYSDKLAPVTAICEDGDGTMWLGTRQGLVTLEYEKGKTEITGGYEAGAGLGAGEVLALYVNNYNQIFASYVNKILQIDGKEKKITSSLLLKKDFANGHINCMVDDGNGNTWLGTNAGLITINNRNNSSYNYSFPEHYYNVCLLNNGHLLWASSSGLFYFDPRLLKEDSEGRKLYISDIDVNYRKVEIGEKVNGQVILDKPVYQTDHLDLNYRNNNLVIYLSDLKFGNVSNRVEYRLLPADNKWTSGNNNQITLSNLSEGDYTLEVRPVSPLTADTTITRLTITVGEYWAASWWAVILYILTGGVLSFAIWYYLNLKKNRRHFYLEKEQKLKQKLEEEKQKREEEQKINMARDQVRLMLAKELRTPLSLIIAPLKEMKEQQNLPSALLQKAEIAYRSSVSIQDVCNQLFGIYQHRNNDYQLNVASYSINNLANSVVHSFYELLNSCPVTLYYDKEKKVDGDIWIDYKRIEFTLQCIFSNAYRHISYSGSIWFTINITEIDNKKYCLFVVKDDGKNIVEESSIIYLSKAGYEMENVSAYRDLALDVMKDMAAAHHGDIKIDRRKDEGTTVTLYLPLGKEHFVGDENVTFVEADKISEGENVNEAVSGVVQHPDEPVEKAEPQQKITSSENKYTLLIIEDHQDIRTYLKVLFAANYNILVAENGEQGVEIARRVIPDLIITDIMMPVMDGFECCRILKEDLNTCHIPIILLTALAEEEDLVKGIELGADEYIYKPFNPEILRIKVKHLIKSRIELKQAYTKLLMPSASDSEQETEEIKAEDPFIEQILEITNQNLQNPNFSVKWLAEELNMSQATLYRRIKQSTDFSLIELIRGVRLKRAAELLKTRKYSVQEVAEMVGYNDIPTFRKHFVDFYGTTPSNFYNKSVEG